MTGTNSQFNQRSDNAALRLKSEINHRNVGNPEFQPLAPSPVQVTADGQPPAPPPPPGSYAEQALQQQQAQQGGPAAPQAPAGQPTPQQQLGVQPPAGTPEQQADGSVAPPLTEGQPGAVGAEPPAQAPEVSPNANARIQQLIGDLRERDRQIAELSASNTELEQLRQQVGALQAERDTFLQSHLDELPPEERAAVMQDARTREMLQQHSAALLGEIDRRLAPLQEQGQQSELEKVARKYPAFDMQIHQHLIEQFRAKNPACTVEQAYRAIAEGDELVTRDQASAVAVPPVVAPNANGAQLPRYMPEPQPDPQATLVDFQNRTNALLRSNDPDEQRQGMRQMDQLLDERLRGSSYDGKPGVFD